MIWINCGLLAGLVLQVNILGLTVEFPQQGFALLALIPIWLYRGRQGYHSRWVQTALLSVLSSPYPGAGDDGAFPAVRM